MPRSRPIRARSLLDLTTEDPKRSTSRKFLNDNVFGGLAGIETVYEPYSSNGCWAVVKVSDCNRTATLEFGIDSEKEKKSRLKKIDTLVAELQAFRAKLESTKVKK
jgi:hypothetical protein